MFYCEKCRRLSPFPLCTACGAEPLPEAAEGDSVFLCSQDFVWSGLVRNVLEDNGIPFISRSDIGAGMAAQIGQAFERTLFYVPAGRYNDAAELMTALFTPEDAGRD